MTQTPRHGEAAPVDATGRRDAATNGAASNGHAASSGGATSSGSAPSAASSGSTVQKLPRPDTPTDTVPVVKDAEGRDVPGGSPTTATPASTGSSSGTAGSGVGSSSTTGSSSGSRRGRARGPRRAKLQLRHINPWTVLKFSCVLAVALFFVWLIVVGVLYGILDAAGVVGRINDAYLNLKSDGGSPPLTAGTVFGTAAIIGLLDIVLFIALSTIGSVVYNLCADLVGGIEVTLSER